MDRNSELFQPTDTDDKTILTCGDCRWLTPKREYYGPWCGVRKALPPALLSLTWGKFDPEVREDRPACLFHQRYLYKIIKGELKRD